MWRQRFLRLGLVLVLGLMAMGIDWVMHKPAGDYCKGPSECRSRLCSGEGYCTKHCRGDGDCPNGFQCRESRVYTNKLDMEMAGYGVKGGGKLERLCVQ